MSCFYKILYLLILSISLPFLSEGAVMHTILVGDTNAEDLQDGIIQDILGTSSFFKRAAGSCGIPNHEYILMHNAVEAEAIYSLLQDLEVGQDDIVVFYFSGHGYRTPQKESSPLPYLFFSDNYKSIDLEEVLNVIRKKNPRLILTLADCCNNMISFTPPELIRPKGAKTLFDHQQANYNHLFMNYKGEVIAIGSEPEGYSIGTSTGSVFTKVLLDILYKAIYLSREESPISWEEILDDTRYFVGFPEYSYGCRQIPYFEVHLEPLSL